VSVQAAAPVTSAGGPCSPKTDPQERDHAHGCRPREQVQHAAHLFERPSRTEPDQSEQRDCPFGWKKVSAEIREETAHHESDHAEQNDHIAVDRWTLIRARLLSAVVRTQQPRSPAPSRFGQPS
jgi:hypothetical protein